ncbi:MAG: alpha/beta hydrolase [Acidobacteriota bacterium]
MQRLWRSLVVALSFFVATSPIAAQDATDSVVEIMHSFGVVPDVTYLRADGYESKLDVYVPRDRSTRRPTVVYIHGGGWVGGDKDASTLSVLPYLQMGFAAVNVEYRLAGEALAPGAVEDTRCALRWVYQNAEEYGFDTERIVVTGASAGGHLSLTTGMLTAERGFDRRCPVRIPPTDGRGRADTEPVEMPVAAIVNWFGITDVPDLLEGENAKTYAVAWMGSLPNRKELGDELSPLTMVNSESNPPVLTLHGDADLIVPYAHATRLHEKLDDAGVANRLHTVSGGGHGNFTVDEYKEAFRVIREFLHSVFSGS